MVALTKRPIVQRPVEKTQEMSQLPQLEEEITQLEQTQEEATPQENQIDMLQNLLEMGSQPVFNMQILSIMQGIQTALNELSKINQNLNSISQQLYDQNRLVAKSVGVVLDE